MPEPRCDGGTGEGRPTVVDCRGARGRRVPGARGPPLASAGRGAALRPWSLLGGVSPLARFETCQQGVVRARRRVQPPRGPAAPRL